MTYICRPCSKIRGINDLIQFLDRLDTFLLAVPYKCPSSHPSQAHQAFHQGHPKGHLILLHNSSMFVVTAATCNLNRNKKNKRIHMKYEFIKIQDVSRREEIHSQCPSSTEVTKAIEKRWKILIIIFLLLAAAWHFLEVSRLVDSKGQPLKVVPSQAMTLVPPLRSPYTTGLI